MPYSIVTASSSDGLVTIVNSLKASGSFAIGGPMLSGSVWSQAMDTVTLGVARIGNFEMLSHNAIARLSSSGYTAL